MIYVVTYFNGKKWIEFLSFTHEEYAVNFMNHMKKYYPDLDIKVKSKLANEYERTFAININIADKTTF